LVVIAPYTFGVYLIHDNNFIRTLLWYKEINIDQYLGSVWLLPMMLGVIVSIFLICALIDFLRSEAFRYFKVDQFIHWLSSIIDKVCLKVWTYCKD
jgi:hypothetical protein